MCYDTQSRVSIGIDAYLSNAKTRFQPTPTRSLYLLPAIYFIHNSFIIYDILVRRFNPLPGSQSQSSNSDFDSIPGPTSLIWVAHRWLRRCYRYLHPPLNNRTGADRIGFQQRIGMPVIFHSLPPAAHDDSVSLGRRRGTLKPLRDEYPRMSELMQRFRKWCEFSIVSLPSRGYHRLNLADWHGVKQALGVSRLSMTTDDCLE